MGIVGGMGPAASIRLEELIYQKDAERIELHGCDGFLTDSWHTPFLMYNNPRIPNCCRAACGLGPSPMQALVDSTAALQRAGADAVTFCCTTAYAWKDQVARQVPGILILDLLQIVAQKVASARHHRVGLLDVDGTHCAGRFLQALRRYDLQVVLPTPREQAQLMEAVADLKLGVDPYDGPVDTLVDIIEHMMERERVTAIVLGCTEIAASLGCTNDKPQQMEYFDSLDILANEIVLRTNNHDFVSSTDGNEKINNTMVPSEMNKERMLECA